MFLLTAAFHKFKSSAAALKLPSSITRRKTVIARNLSIILIQIILFTIGKLSYHQTNVYQPNPNNYIYIQLQPHGKTTFIYRRLNAPII